MLLDDECFQESLLRDYKMTLVVDRSNRQDAKLEFEGGGELRVVKSRGMEKVPVSSRVIFRNKQEVSQFKE